MEDKIKIFTTTDDFPIFVGDHYYQLNDKNQIEIWRCDEGDDIPINDTYKECENVNWVQRENDYQKDLLTRIPDLHEHYKVITICDLKASKTVSNLKELLSNCDKPKIKGEITKLNLI